MELHAFTYNSLKYITTRECHLSKCPGFDAGGFEKQHVIITILESWDFKDYETVFKKIQIPVFTSVIFCNCPEVNSMHWMHQAISAWHHNGKY
jgi:hypothetical protein